MTKNHTEYQKILNDLEPNEEEIAFNRVFTLIDLDELFEKSPNAKIINNDNLVSNKFSKEVTNAIFSNSNGELGFVPTCECGATYGLAKQGLICPHCNTECCSQFVNSLSHNAWLGIPAKYAPVLHPIVYMTFRKWTEIGKRSTSIIDRILNPEAELPDDLIPYFAKHGFDINKCRGFRFFYENVDVIFQILAYEYPRTAKKASTKNIITFYRHYRKVMFTRHLPILHSSLHPLKSSGGTLKYTDNTSKDILSAIIDLSLVTFRSHAVRTTTRQTDTTLFKIYTKVINYYTSLITNKLGSKQALLRKHVFGSRTHFSARSVVTPHDRILPLDEVILPWKMIVNSYKLQILNILMHRQHMPLEDALTKFMTALTQYDPDIDKVVQTILSEFPGGRMAIAIGRNPTLAYGSIMKLYVREFRKDPDDETLSINACIVKPANIDFDGDEIYHIDILTQKLADALSTIHPSSMLFDIASPGLGSRIGLLQQNWVTLEAFLEDDEDESEFYKEL